LRIKDIYGKGLKRDSRAKKVNPSGLTRLHCIFNYNNKIINKIFLKFKSKQAYITIVPLAVTTLEQKKYRKSLYTADDYNVDDFPRLEVRPYAYYDYDL